MPELTAGHDLALAVSQNCMNKVAAIVYRSGILPTAIEGDLAPVSALAGCLPSIPLIGSLLTSSLAPGNYRFRAELKQPVFDFAGSSQIHISGGAEAAILVNGVQQASVSFDLALPITVSLVSPGSRPAQPDEPQVQVDVGQTTVTPHVTGLPAGLEWILGQLGDALTLAFVDHVLNIPAFPAFFRAEGYGVVLKSLEVTPDQLIVRTDLEWPGRPLPGMPVLARPVMTKVPFTLRRPQRTASIAPSSTSSLRPISNLATTGRYRPIAPVARPGDIIWPHHGPEYDFALALNQKPIQQVLDEKFPISFSHRLAAPIGRVDFSLDASFQLMDAAVDKIKLGASISGENSRSAVIQCDGRAEFRIEVALRHDAKGVKGEVAVAEVDIKRAKCKNTNLGLEVSAAKLTDWLADPANLRNAIADKLTERFGEPLIPLTFTIFQQTISDSNLTVSIDLSNVDIVQDELQVWITVNEATAPRWRWLLGQLPEIHG
jgi:hypothetical protein